MNDFTLCAEAVYVGDYIFDIEAECECTYYCREEQTWDNPGCEDFEYKVNSFELVNIEVWDKNINDWTALRESDLQAFEIRKDEIRDRALSILENDCRKDAYIAFMRTT